MIEAVEWSVDHDQDVHGVTQEYSMSTTEYAQLAEATDK